MTQSSQKQETLDVVNRYHLAWRERDLETILSCYHPDIHYHDFFQNTVFTQANIKQYIADSLTTAELVHIAPIRADGDTAFIEYTISLQEQKGLALFRASEAISVKDGLVWRIHEYATLVPVDGEKVVPSNSSLSRLGLSTRQVANMSQEVRDFLAKPAVLTQPQLNLQKLANDTGYSRNQLSFLFNQVFGARFLQFINEQRITWVLDQIQQDHDQTVESLGLAAGFNSASVFYKYFRQVTGQSPKAYIKNLP
jgi:AraC-like DNA-binding protein